MVDCISLSEPPLGRPSLEEAGWIYHSKTEKLPKAGKCKWYRANVWVGLAIQGD